MKENISIIALKFCVKISKLKTNHFFLFISIIQFEGTHGENQLLFPSFPVLNTFITNIV